MTRFSLLLTGLLLAGNLFAAEIPPEILLWPKGAPGSEGKTEKELVEKSASGDVRITRIHNPSITVYLPPKEKATGASVLVIPGGGHRVLVMTHEGYNVAEWLSQRGIAAFVLKHRLARETNSTYQIEVHAFADTQRAIRLIRSRANEWNIDPARLGVMGFSAGGELAAQAGMKFDNGITGATDPIDQQGSKPAFQALIYPGNSKAIIPLKDSPPAFLACGYGDRQDISEGLANVYLLFKKAGVPADLHIYAGAGHGFGYRESNKGPAGAWIQRFYEFLGDRKLLIKP
jgi:endo-1,4-beta-xylanase